MAMFKAVSAVSAVCSYLTYHQCLVCKPEGHESWRSTVEGAMIFCVYKSYCPPEYGRPLWVSIDVLLCFGASTSVKKQAARVSGQKGASL